MAWDAQGYDRQFSFVTDLGGPLLDLLAALPGDRVLDLGCGTGHQAAELTKTGADVVGLDSDAAMIARAQDEHPGTTYVLGDAQRLSPEGPLAAPFDAVLSNAALHWMPDQQAVIDGVHALLRPGGRFVSEQGGRGNIARVWAALAASAADLGIADPTLPWAFPSPAEQAARLERAGFVVRLAQLVDRPTRLAPDATVATWIEMFGRDVLSPLPVDVRTELLARVDAHSRVAGLQDDEGWWADYVRLRFVAERA